MTTATHIYHLQKQIEDTVAKCRTLAFFTNDTKLLEEALAHCEAARAELATSTTSAQDHGPPIYTAFEKAGVEELKKTTKLSHRVGVKHKRRKVTALGKMKVQSEPLLGAAITGVGQPKLK